MERRAIGQEVDRAPGFSLESSRTPTSQLDPVFAQAAARRYFTCFDATELYWKWCQANIPDIDILKFAHIELIGCRWLVILGKSGNTIPTWSKTEQHALEPEQPLFVGLPSSNREAAEFFTALQVCSRERRTET